jgi:hypothetical protein
LNTYFIDKSGDISELESKISNCLANVEAEIKQNTEYGFEFADVMRGALARRTEILDTFKFDLELMSLSLKTGERIPSNYEKRFAGEWW